MSSFPHGEWRIDGVLINQETVMNDEGFRFLQIADEDLAIQPAGLTFAVKQSTQSSAVLESRGQVFFAEFKVNADRMTIELTRPKFKETIQIEAELVNTKVFATVDQG